MFALEPFSHQPRTLFETEHDGGRVVASVWEDKMCLDYDRLIPASFEHIDEAVDNIRRTHESTGARAPRN